MYERYDKRSPVGSRVGLLPNASELVLTVSLIFVKL